MRKGIIATVTATIVAGALMTQLPATHADAVARQFDRRCISVARCGALLQISCPNNTTTTTHFMEYATGEVISSCPHYDTAATYSAFSSAATSGCPPLEWSCSP